MLAVVFLTYAICAICLLSTAIYAVVFLASFSSQPSTYGIHTLILPVHILVSQRDDYGNRFLLPAAETIANRVVVAVYRNCERSKPAPIQAKSR